MLRQLLDRLLQLGTKGIRDSILFPTPRLSAGLQAQTGVLRTVGPSSLRLGRQGIRENLRVPTRQGELVLGVLLAPADALALLGPQLLREAAPRLLCLLQRVSVQTEGLGLGLQAHEVRPPLDLLDRVQCSACPQGRPWVLKKVVQLGLSATLPPVQGCGGVVEDVHSTLPALVLPGADDSWGHRALPRSQDVDAHRVTAQLHAETYDVWKPDNEVELVEVDDD